MKKQFTFCFVRDNWCIGGWHARSKASDKFGILTDDRRDRSFSYAHYNPHARYIFKCIIPRMKKMLNKSRRENFSRH